ncbi:MAG: hypothetical protein PHH26_01655 [Candidatus Thermoplasmatota archaeon]|nr:hypothetical protein [Candidatus Thermoplasmatota archaeon]
MAESYNTLAGLVQFNDKNLADLQVTDLLDDAPLLKILYAMPASNGTLHKYLKQTTASSAAFRAALAGVAKTASADTLVTDTLKILDGSFDTDVALADAYKGGRDAWLQLELIRTMKQVFAVAEKQVFYGTGADASGFAGLIDNAQLDALADGMVVNAGGSNVSTQTSCFVLRHGANDCAFILGNDGKIVVEDEPVIIQKTADSTALDAAQFYPALYVPVTGYCGFQIGSAYSAARICNIECNDLTSTSAFTDDHIYGALSKFPAGRQPNVVVMNRNALRLLRQSRTATNATGAPAPRPVEVEGIPIVVTDQILSTEAVVS